MRQRGNNAERDVIESLEQDGWDVTTRGWPDLVATKDGRTRFIKVQPQGSRGDLRPAQAKVAGILKQLGAEVEVVVSRKSGHTKRRDLDAVED